MNRKMLIWALLLMFACMFCFSGCGTTRAVTQLSKLQQEADHAVVLADAATIASSINVHNAVYGTDSPNAVTAIGSLDDLKTKLGKDWPDTMTDERAKAALPLITITDGVADIKKESAQPAS